MPPRKKDPAPQEEVALGLAEGIDPRVVEETPSQSPPPATAMDTAAEAFLTDLVDNPIFATKETSGRDPAGAPWITKEPTGPLAPDSPDIDAYASPATGFPATSPTGAPQSVRLARPFQGETWDRLLWTLIRNRTNAISFTNYFNFANNVLCGEWNPKGVPRSAPDPGFHTELRNLGTEGYATLKAATELFLMHEAGIFVDPTAKQTLQPQLQQMYDAFISPNAEAVRRNFDPLPANWLTTLRDGYYEALLGSGQMKVLPYFNLILDRLQDLAPKVPEEIFVNCYGVLPGWVTGPLAIELIWSYWHEEGMLAQTTNAISNRFQNRRVPGNSGGPDPLARLEIDPLRRLNHYIWGWVQNEPFRLSVHRRAYEYDHEYGLPLLGKAIKHLRGADSRSKFIEAFHNLLFTTVTFHLQDDDLTVQADGFPVLNALRETQLVLTEGSHNQYGDLPWVARVEMMMQQWMLGRPEMREFLGGRVMVPYLEPWMDRVDTVKTMMSWTPTNVTHFRDLGVFGEQVLLSVRYGVWSKEIRPEAAANWARYWRPEIQGYVHAYRAVTGIDLRQGVESTVPGVLLQRRLGSGSRAALTR